jgi:hypothetical protein
LIFRQSQNKEELLMRYHLTIAQLERAAQELRDGNASRAPVRILGALILITGHWWMRGSLVTEIYSNQEVE